jgi:cation:H+ antiporter
LSICFFVRYALTSWPRKPTRALEAAVLVIIVLGRYDEQSPWIPDDVPESDKDTNVFISSTQLEGLSTRSLILLTALVILLILIAGFVAANRADVIADQTGLGASSVGVAFLAASTSMPELFTTIAAARMGAYTMVISIIFGSNLIVVALILPAEIAYRGWPILGDIDKVAQFSIVIGILVTAIYICGILIRRTPRLPGAGIGSFLVLAVYLLGLVAAYNLSFELH